MGSRDYEYTRFKFVRNEPGAKRPVVELVAVDSDTAFRMLDNAVCGWDLTKLRLVTVAPCVTGPNHFIRIDPDVAPMIEPLGGAANAVQEVRSGDSVSPAS